MSGATATLPDAVAQTEAVSAPPAILGADRAQRERLRSEAERWLASLPIRTVRRKGVRGSNDRPHPRLVMYRTAAGTPEFWEKTWLVSPPYRMRGYTLPTWYRDAFKRWLPSDGLIVEAGCGNGNLLRMLANEDPARWGNFASRPGEGACIEGLDFAENAIAENRRVHPEGRYRPGDVRALPYADGELSAYLSMGVVEHFEEAERAAILCEAARALRPGGVAVITVPFFSPARKMRAAIGGFADESTIARERKRGEPNLDFYQFYFSKQEIVGQIQAAGLRVVALDGYDCRRGFADAFGAATGRMLDRVSHLSKKWARRIDHPPRPIRLFCPHMLMVMAIKPGG